MKKLPLIAAAGILLLSACRKEGNLSPTPTSNTKPSLSAMTKVAPDGLIDQVSVSDYGFLVLADTPEYANYMDFLDGNNAEDIADFHQSIGFTSQANVEGQAGNYFSPSTNNAEYLFNQSGIVQVGNIIFRGVNSDGYLLAMPASNLTDDTYTQLAAKEFNPSAMCKLWIGDSHAQDMPSLEEFVIKNIGFDGTTEGNPQPTPVEICGKKVVHWYSTPPYTVLDESWYFLGFRYKHVVTIWGP